MKIKCTVIRDILPLYVEKIVSEDTKTLVEEHIRECIDCQKELDEMKAFDEIPIDVNSNGLKNVKSKLFRDKFKAIIFSIMITIIVSIMAINYLTEPTYIPYSNDIVSINEKENGEIFANFGDTVSGYNIDKYLSEDGISYIYHISTWETFWSKLSNKKKTDTVVLNPNNEKVSTIYYYSAGQSDDVLIYGKNLVGNGGVLTLPRLFLASYLCIAILLMGILLIIMLAVYKFKKVQIIIRNILFIPMSYIIGTICIKGFNTTSYSATRDFFTILLISIPIYFVLVLSINFYKSFKNKRQ